MLHYFGDTGFSYEFSHQAMLAKPFLYESFTSNFGHNFD